MDDTKTIQQKTVETLQIATKWEQENSLKINAAEVRINEKKMIVQTNVETNVLASNLHFGEKSARSVQPSTSKSECNTQRSSYV